MKVKSYTEQNALRPVVSGRLSPTDNTALMALCTKLHIDRATVVEQLVTNFLETHAKPVNGAVVPVKFSSAPQDADFIAWLANPLKPIDAFLEPKLVYFTTTLTAAIVARTMAEKVNVREPEHSKKFQQQMRKKSFYTCRAFKIILDRNGYAIDGLGRLHAMMTSGKNWSYWVEVVDNADAVVVQHCADTGTLRKLYVRIADKLGVDYDPRTAVSKEEKAAKKKRRNKVMNCITNFCTNFYRDQHEVDAKEAIECLDSNLEAMRWAIDATANAQMSAQKGPVIAALAKLYLANPTKAKAFVEHVVDGDTQPTQPSAFQNWLNVTSTAGASRIPRVHSVALYCFNNFCTKTPIKGAIVDTDATKNRIASKQIEATYRQQSAGLTC